jgi:hypothetical protein
LDIHSSNNTHVLKDYLGGYAITQSVRRFTTCCWVISGVGLSNKFKTTYIPVGQGFLCGKSRRWRNCNLHVGSLSERKLMLHQYPFKIKVKPNRKQNGIQMQ